MKRFNIILLTLFCSALTFKSLSQNQFPDIDTKWDDFYKGNPSGIEKNYEGIDFIKIIELVEFEPQSPPFKNDAQLLKKAILMLDGADLRQMMITGSYYSRTFKHDDYFALYNLYYRQITKESWDKYCPYLIPLMDLDSTIKLH